MKKVYIITKGDYSEYHICGVYSTKDIAEEVIEIYKGDDMYAPYIEEWDLNQYLNRPKNCLPFRIAMKEDGSVYDILCGYSECYLNDIESDKNRVFVSPTHYYKEPWRYVYTWAKNKDHAIKIANEDRLMRIANNIWDK